MPHTRPDAGSRMARVGPHQRSDRRLVGQRRYGARTQDHERVFQGRHHGKREPVELKTECDVIRMDSLTHTLRQLGGGARLSSAADELSSICPGLGGPPSDVLSARQIFIGLPILTSDHERDTATLACSQEPSRCLRHHEAGAQHQRCLLDRECTDRPCRGFLHNGPSAKVNRPQQARRVDGVEPRRGRTVFERHPILVPCLERQGFVQRLSKNDLFRPLAKGPGSHGESTHDVDYDRHGRGFGQLRDAKETRVHTDHDRACLTQCTQRVIRVTSTVSECNTSGCLRHESGPQRPACSIATLGHPHTASADTSRLFITDAILNGLPPHIAQVIAGHQDINVTLGYKAVYPEEAIQTHMAFLARRRSLRPSEEYRVPTDEEWQEFLGHFERRKVSIGACGRAVGTPCIHEHACVRCPMLWPDPAQRDRLGEIRDNLLARIAEADREGWLGEVEGLRISLAGAEDKLTQLNRRCATGTSVDLGMPSFAKTTARTTPGDRS